MNSKKLLALYGLKWNPFSPELPSEALLATPKIENFAWRVEQLVQEGGFALITGESGTGKSVVVRIQSAPRALEIARGLVANSPGALDRRGAGDESRRPVRAADSLQCRLRR